jgi:tripartite-type tricarboxylate transporter receptor subunit TctC
MRQTLCAFGLAVLAAVSPLAVAQSFPTKPLKIVLGTGPGGLADVTTRLVGQKLSERLGQPVVIENRPGAGGIAAAQSVLAAPADGHTIFVMLGGNAISRSLLKSQPFDLEKDFAPITSVAFFDLLLLVKGDAPFRSVQDLLAAAKAKPGGIGVGTTSVGSIQSLAALLLASTTGMKANMIPYKTSGDIMAAVLRGDVEFGIDAYASLKGGIDSGQLRAVVATGAARSPMQPNVPTMKESGIAGYEVTSWNSFFTGAGAPPAAIATLNRHVGEILQQADVRKRFVDIGAEPRASTPEQMGAFLKQSIEQWAAVIERAGIPKQ